MLETLRTVFNYLKKPTIDEEENKQLSYRISFFTKLLGISVLFGFATTPLFVIFEEFGWIDMEQHKLEDAFKDMSPLLILLVAGILVPFFEELIFRGPLTLFKKPNRFKWSFYAFTLAFGFIHITNYDISTAVLLLSPFLVLPQLFVGVALGYIRVRFGLIWSIALHAVYNSLFFSISFLAEA